MNKLIFATNNLHKLGEIRELLAFSYEVDSLKDRHISIEIPENGSSFRENAFIKADTIFRLTGINCFADDSGLSVSALQGRPGVASARFAGEPANDTNNRLKLLKQMEHQSDRSAFFTTVLCLLLQEQCLYFEGTVKGVIAHKERGEYGFGYDSLFIPEGYERTFAQMEPKEKNAISHRSIAVKKMADFLLQIKP